MDAAPGSGRLIQAHETTQLTVQLDQLLGDRDQLRACQVASRAAAVTQFIGTHRAPPAGGSVCALATTGVGPK